jgi:hypothetical protein
MRIGTEAPARAKRGMNIMIQANRHLQDCGINSHSAELSPKHARYRGIALVWTAIFGVLIILLVGLSLDTARVALGLHRLNNAADAGALAGALFVKFNQTQARTTAVATAAANYAEELPVAIDNNLSNDPNGELVLGRWIRQLRQFVPTTVAPSAVKVVSRRLGQRENAPLFSLIFGAALANVPTAAIERHAVAWSRGSTGAGIIALAKNPRIFKDYHNINWNSDSGLVMDGGTVLDLRGVDPETGEPMMGDIQINSLSTNSPKDSFVLNGTSATIYAGEFNVGGTSNPDADNAGAWENLYADSSVPFSVNPYSDPIIDPLLGLVPPDVGAMSIPIAEVIDSDYVRNHGVAEVNPDTGLLTGLSVLTLSPGYYPGGIRITDPGTKVVLSGGADAIYAVGGGDDGTSGLVSNGGSLIADGVMIYVTGDPDANDIRTGAVEWAKIDIGGNAPIEITSRGDAMDPPQIEGEIGVAIWQDRSNPTWGEISGTSSIDIIGTVYCGYNPMTVGGTSDHTGTQLIAGALNLHGNVSLGIAYDGRNAIEAYHSILVE